MEHYRDLIDSFISPLPLDLPRVKLIAFKRRSDYPFFIKGESKNYFLLTKSFWSTPTLIFTTENLDPKSYLAYAMKGYANYRVSEGRGYSNQPLWYQQGLSQYLATVEPTSIESHEFLLGTSKPKECSPSHIEGYTYSNIILNQKSQSDTVFCGYSWMILQYMFATHPSALNQYLASFDTAEPVDHKLIFKSTFGYSLDEVEQKIQEYTTTGKSAYYKHIPSKQKDREILSEDLSTEDLAYLLAELGLIQQRLTDEYIQEQMVLYPENRQFKVLRARNFVQKHQYSSAIETLNPLLDIYPDDAELVILKAQALAGKRAELSSPNLAHETSEALSWAKRAVELDPNQGLAHETLVRVLLFEKQPNPQSINQSLLAATNRLPARAIPHGLMLAQIMAYSGRMEKAQNLLTQYSQNVGQKEVRELIARLASNLETQGPHVDVISEFENSLSECLAVSIHRAEPTYPSSAANQWKEGWVELSYNVNAEGSPEQVSVTESSPPKVFDKTSLQALKRWKFQGPVSSKCHTRFRFHLR